MASKDYFSVTPQRWASSTFEKQQQDLQDVYSKAVELATDHLYKKYAGEK